MQKDVEETASGPLPVEPQLQGPQCREVFFTLGAETSSIGDDAATHAAASCTTPQPGRVLCHFMSFLCSIALCQAAESPRGICKQIVEQQPQPVCLACEVQRDGHAPGRRRRATNLLRSLRVFDTFLREGRLANGIKYKVEVCADQPLSAGGQGQLEHAASLDLFGSFWCSSPEHPGCHSYWKRQSVPSSSTSRADACGKSSPRPDSSRLFETL